MKRQSIMLIPLLGLLSFSASSANLYVGANGNNKSNCKDAQNRCRTIGYAISQMSGGDTLYIGDGLYDNTNDAISGIPSGKENQYTTIRAENISKDSSKVTINRQLKIAHNEQYIRIDGLKFTGNYEKSIEGHHIKLTQNAFEGGPVDGNTANLSLGTNNHNDTHHILIEDSSIYGKGGRYKLLAYQVKDVVIRRVVIRPDGGWALNQSQPGAGYGNTPEAGVSIYNSTNVELQNVIVLDGITTAIYNGKPESWTSAFYYPQSSDSPYPANNIRTVGSIAMNNIGTSYMFESSNQRSNTTIEHSIAWKPDNANGFIKEGVAVSAGVGVSMSNLSLINIYGNAIGNWHANGDIRIKNSVLTNYQNNFYAEGSVYESNNVCSGRVACNGEGDTNFDPLQKGLTHLLDSSHMQSNTNSSNANQIGAKVINQIGKSDSYYGETGFNKEQNVALWPWGNESRIKQDLCDGVNIEKRGLCNDKAVTFTQYIWEALGHSTPENLTPMAPPLNPIWRKN